MREEGFYWLSEKRDSKLTIGMFEQGLWELLGTEELWTDRDVFRQFEICGIVQHPLEVIEDKIRNKIIPSDQQVSKYPR